MSIELIHGDCLAEMPKIPDGSIDLILTDPPYGTVKGIGGKTTNGMKGKMGWDNIIEHSRMIAECVRLLRVNGTLILFSQDPYTAKLMTEVASKLPFSYRLTWLKDHFANSLIAKTAPVIYTEDICVFFKKYVKHDFEGFHPLRPYAKKAIEYIGLAKKELFLEMGHQGICHFLRYETTQFSLCTEKTYSELVSLYSLNKMRGFREFIELANEDRDYRDKLIEKMTLEAPRVFNLPYGKKYKSNVLAYKKDYTGYHPTQKPIALIEDLVSTYTNEGDKVLDFTMGSGTTGVACKNLKRDFIGIEKEKEHYDTATKRVKEARKIVGFFDSYRSPTPSRVRRRR